MDTVNDKVYLWEGMFTRIPAESGAVQSENGYNITIFIAFS